jgi:hypothetical protein
MYASGVTTNSENALWRARARSYYPLAPRKMHTVISQSLLNLSEECQFSEKGSAVSGFPWLFLEKVIGRERRCYDDRQIKPVWPCHCGGTVRL